MVVLPDVECRVCKCLYDVTLEYRHYTICPKCKENQENHYNLVMKLDELTANPDV